MKRLLLLISILAISLILPAQTHIDVIYLNNNTIIKGLIFEKSNNEIKIKTPDNKTHTFSTSDIEKMETEKIPSYVFSDTSELSLITDENTTTKKKHIKPSPTTKHSYIGAFWGVGIPTRKEERNSSILKDNFELNAAFIGHNNVGIAFRLIFTPHDRYSYKYKRRLPPVCTFIGYTVSVPWGKIVSFDLRPMVGISEMSLLAVDLGVSLRFHATTHLDFIINSDLIIPDFMEEYRDKLPLTIGIGAAFRL